MWRSTSVDSTVIVCPVSILWRGGVSCPVSAAWHSCVAAHWLKYHCYKQAPSRYDLRCLKATLNPNQNKLIYIMCPFLVTLNEWVWLERSPCGDVGGGGGGVNFFSFSTSLKPLHGIAANFVWMFLGWIPTKFVKIRMLSLFFMELWVILCNFWPILKKIFFYKTND